MSCFKFSISALPVSRWANGHGETRVAVCWPPKSSMENFSWRLSFATMTHDGPFSLLPGVARYISLVKMTDNCSGVCIKAQESSQERACHQQSSEESFCLDRPGHVFLFDGGKPYAASLVSTAPCSCMPDLPMNVTDFNLMVRDSLGVYAVPGHLSSPNVSVEPLWACSTQPSDCHLSVWIGSVLFCFTDSTLNVQRNGVVEPVRLLAGAGLFWVQSDTPVNDLSPSLDIPIPRGEEACKRASGCEGDVIHFHIFRKT